MPVSAVLVQSPPPIPPPDFAATPPPPAITDSYLFLVDREGHAKFIQAFCGNPKEYVCSVRANTTRR